MQSHNTTCKAESKKAGFESTRKEDQGRIHYANSSSRRI